MFGNKYYKNSLEKKMSALGEDILLNKPNQLCLAAYIQPDRGW